MTTERGRPDLTMLRAALGRSDGRRWLAPVLLVALGISVAGRSPAVEAQTEPPPASPTSAPVSVEPTRLDRKVSVRRDGVRLTLELDHNPLVAGQPTWATTTVENLGRRDILWQHAALCRIGVWVEGIHQDVEWSDGEGRRSPGGTFRWHAEHDLGDPTIRLRFTPRMLVGEGQTGCTDVAAGSTIPPGGVLRERSRWDGTAGWKLIPPPDGRVRVTAAFEDYKRVGQKGGPRDRLEVGLDALIVGGRDDLLAPMVVVDAALADPDFAAFIEAQHVGEASGSIYQYRPDLGLWEIGAFDYRDDRFSVALVDPGSGDVQAFIERPWDEGREDYPE